MSKSEVRYQDVSSTELNSRAANLCKVTLVPDEAHPEDIVVQGCPQCGHETTWSEPVIVVRGIDIDVTGDLARVLLDGFRDAGSPINKRDVTVRCQCNHPHPGAPKGVMGCGRWWSLKVGWGN